MSNADEIIKLKKLLDTNIITQEEFEKKKDELLNNADNLNISNESNSHNPIKEKKKKRIVKIILIILLIYLIRFSSFKC